MRVRFRLLFPFRCHQLIEFLDTLRYCFPSGGHGGPLAEGRENGLANATCGPVVLDQLEVVLPFHHFFSNEHPFSYQPSLAIRARRVVREFGPARNRSKRCFKGDIPEKYASRLILGEVLSRPCAVNILMCFGNGTPSRHASKTGHRGDQRPNDANHGRHHRRQSERRCGARRLSAPLAIYTASFTSNRVPTGTGRTTAATECPTSA